MINAIAMHQPAELAGTRFVISYLLALHSLWAFGVAGLWVRVWHAPENRRVAVAALATAVLLIIEGLRLSSAVVLDSAV